MRAFAFFAVVLLTASLAFAQNVFHPVEELKAGIFGALVGGGNYTFNNSLVVVDKLGIGTATPNATLDVNGSVAVPNEGSGGYYTAKNAAGTSKIILAVSNNGMASDATRIRSAGGGISLEDSSANTLVSILNGGNVGIGKIPSSEKLEVNGNILANAFFYSSDIRLKTDIRPIPDPEKILQLKGVLFKFKNDTKQSVGLIAQDVEKVLPEIVSTDGKGMKSVDYGKLSVFLIEVLKQQQEKIKDLQDEIESLKVND